MSLTRCARCNGFVPAHSLACPNCSAPSPARGLLSRVGLAGGILGGGAVAFTLMACYGMPPCNDPAGCDYRPPPSEDAGEDSGIDTDAGTDAGTDAAADGGGDAAADARTDAATDDGGDAATDGGTDAPTDAGTDAPTDAGSDGANDAGDAAG